MSANKHLPHLLVLPEDDANRDLVTGFRLVFSTRQIHTEGVAGGWTKVLETFKTDHVGLMEKYPERSMVLLIDFDGKAERLDRAKAEIPGYLIDRVFILGAWTDPEALTRAGLGSYETIGGKVAKDCREGSHAVLGVLMDWLEEQKDFESVQAVGHRVVHGMQHTAPLLVTRELLDELHHVSPYDPDHLPSEIELIETVRQRHPKLPQVACFDTAFHRTMPRVAKLLPIPRRYDAKGVQRYGFHGLSYAFLMEELARLGDPAATTGRVILAHLGNGASMAAVRNGKSIDTSMSFTPTSGLVMSTRSGDLDPSLGPYLARTEQMTTEQFFKMVNHESGLRGVSEISSDMRDLLAQEAHSTPAAEAVALFCYQAKKWIGSLAAALGGLDTVVFAGGMGENASRVRARICDGLGFLGLELSASRNGKTPGVISTVASRVTVRVIRTDEDLMIARSVFRILGVAAPGEKSAAKGTAALATKLGLDAVEAEIEPAGKVAHVKKLCAAGKHVAMAGDGINDAPALSEAEVGIAMGTGTDVAMQSAGVTLVKGDLRGIAKAIRLSRATMWNIRENLFFAFLYNALGIPLAAGVLYPFFGLLLSPMIAGAAMSLSSVSVIANAAAEEGKALNLLGKKK